MPRNYICGICDIPVKSDCCEKETCEDFKTKWLFECFVCKIDGESVIPVSERDCCNRDIFYDS
jgi:hypothetical protein